MANTHRAGILAVGKETRNAREKKEKLHDDYVEPCMWMKRKPA